MDGGMIHMRGAIMPILVALAVFAAWGGILHAGYVSDDWAWLDRADNGTVIRS